MGMGACGCMCCIRIHDAQGKKEPKAQVGYLNLPAI